MTETLRRQLSRAAFVDDDEAPGWIQRGCASAAECYDGSNVIDFFGYRNFEDRVALSIATLVLNFAVARGLLFVALVRAARRPPCAALDGEREGREASGPAAWYVVACKFVSCKL